MDLLLIFCMIICTLVMLYSGVHADKYYGEYEHLHLMTALLGESISIDEMTETERQEMRKRRILYETRARTILKAGVPYFIVFAIGFSGFLICVWLLIANLPA